LNADITTINKNHIIQVIRNGKYLGEKLLDLFKLLRSELSGVDTLDFPSELRKVLWVRAPDGEAIQFEQTLGIVGAR